MPSLIHLSMAEISLILTIVLLLGVSAQSLLFLYVVIMTFFSRQEYSDDAHLPVPAMQYFEAISVELVASPSGHSALVLNVRNVIPLISLIRTRNTRRRAMLMDFRWTFDCCTDSPVRECKSEERDLLSHL